MFSNLNLYRTNFERIASAVACGHAIRSVGEGLDNDLMKLNYSFVLQCNARMVEIARELHDLMKSIRTILGGEE